MKKNDLLKIVALLVVFLSAIAYNAELFSALGIVLICVFAATIVYITSKPEKRSNKTTSPTEHNEGRNAA